MSTLTAEAPSATGLVAMFSAGDVAKGFKPKFTYKKGEDGEDVLVVDDIAVFRTGSFSDSMGRRNTWEEMHLDGMIANFNMLRDRNIFSNVPIRSGHPGFITTGQDGVGKVVGWHTGLRKETRESSHDSSEYTYLIATYDIIDPEAQKAIASGLWRNRSAEVGTYVTNDDAEYFPVYFGVAYVDIPAVEGLNAFSKGNDTRYIKEESMTAKEQAVTPVVPVAPSIPAPPAVHAAVKEVEEHSAAAVQMAFSINGQSTSDLASVQKHIDTLETFRSETIESSRLDFVNGLVESGRILASNKEATESFAKSLSDSQFGAWKASQEVVANAPLLGEINGATGDHAQQSAVATDAKSDEISILAGTVRQHSRAGKSNDQIKVMSSYKRLIVLDPAFTL